jgi:hypothetical protein
MEDIIMTFRYKKIAGGLAIGAGLAAAGYAGLVAWNRFRYGKVIRTEPNDLLDRFIPSPEVREHHHIAIAAPADIVMQAARELTLLDSRAVRAIFKMRELALGGEPDRREHPVKLLEQAQSIGWVVLAERLDREIVLGAATMPWVANPVFRSIPASEFEAFREPGYVKIIWSLRADPVDSGHTVFHTETRVSTTDAQARDRFRRYWSFVKPGVELIRLAMLRPIKRDAERRSMLAA